MKMKHTQRVQSLDSIKVWFQSKFGLNKGMTQEQAYKIAPSYISLKSAKNNM
jgi:hypothetical protein